MFTLTVDQQALQALSRAIKAETDGNKLRRQLAADMREVMERAVPDVEHAVMALGGDGGIPGGAEAFRRVPRKQATTALRQALISAIKTEARMSGRATGARVRMRTTSDYHGFRNAAKRFNAFSFRHPVFGRDQWVQQMGHRHYFEEPLEARKQELRDAILQAMSDMAYRIKYGVER